MAWLLSENSASKYPETFIRNGRSGTYKIFVNRVTEKLKVEYTSKNFNTEALISEGELIKIDSNPVRSERILVQFFTAYKKKIQKLKDDQVLELFNGIFSVVPKKKLQDYLPKFKFKANSDWFHLYQLLQPIVNGIKFILNLPKLLLQMILQKPAFADLIDLSFVIGASYYIFQLNFNLVHGGTVAAIGALGTGASDHFIRERHPHLLKVLIPFCLGFYVLNLGFKMQ
jgi:hypothetical protein